MTNNTEQIIASVLKGQAWERAKGELEAMLQACLVKNGMEDFNKLDTLIKDFIREVGDQGLEE